jgi:hypothetical protein
MLKITGSYMNEMDILDLYYDELRKQGLTRQTLFMSLDNTAIVLLKQKIGMDVQLEAVHRLADICIANEWLERTTADTYYSYLSLTEAGLQIAIGHQYRSPP